MKLIVRGIKDEILKEEAKAIIREFCDCESVYAKGDFSRKGNLIGLAIYPIGSKSLIGYILYDLTSKTPKCYGVIKRRQVVKTYTLN